MKMTKLGNSRLLFVRQSAQSADINQALALVDGFIEQSRQVELVHEKIFVYPEGNKALVGREISGFPSQMPEGLEFKDFHSAQVWETVMDNKADNFSRLIEEARSLSLKEEKSLFRLVLSEEHFEAAVVQLVEG